MVDLALSPNPSHMTVHNSSNVRKTNSCSFELLSSVQPLKNPEELVERNLHIEACTIIADEIDGLTIFNAATDLNDGVRTLSSILYRVPNQVLPNQSDH